MISRNLLTPIETPTNSQVMTRYKIALQTVGQWRQDQRFARLEPLLEQMSQRLSSIVR